MADPTAATVTQLKNIQARTGQTIAELLAAAVAGGAVKHVERRSWLIEHFKLGYGDANAVAFYADKPLPDLGGGAPSAAAPAANTGKGEVLDALYAGPKAHLRAVHDAVLNAAQALGEFEQAARKTYISLRRKKQFAMVGPATKDQVEVGLNAKDLLPHARLKVLPPGGMCQATTRIGSAAEVDATLKGWLKRAYDAAG